MHLLLYAVPIRVCIIYFPVSLSLVLNVLCNYSSFQNNSMDPLKMVSLALPSTPPLTIVLSDSPTPTRSSHNKTSLSFYRAFLDQNLGACRREPCFPGTSSFQSFSPTQNTVLPHHRIPFHSEKKHRPWKS